MRTIKFRVWHKDLKRWLTSDEWVIGLDGELYFLDYTCDYLDSLQYILDKCPKNKYIIQEFVGVKDKNEKDIYEGDILEWNYDDGDRVSIWIKKRGVVEWDEDWCHFIINSHDERFTIGVMVLKDYKIIGNIFENPELLK